MKKEFILDDKRLLIINRTAFIFFENFIPYQRTTFYIQQTSNNYEAIIPSAPGNYVGTIDIFSNYPEVGDDDENHLGRGNYLYALANSEFVMKALVLPKIKNS